ncbi:YbhB/YbcL family Raf kinase inhibitor-like protein [Deinococcus sp. QL22]|uniref:YbhB/YbcL family Raf kinase inhibitor-like protein n=1 Tax=Deinococcus sp. QL22 TaxID=2939437 RepID=UPI002016EE27|nr:YbhB/YbcL family Raf kinase inhibitor-like protein [Deinococcus sp. QL22]UQN05820.1 YbhB/YbcL family Raf kinase inhibitor-like protein [Deinococcus sp. QL22]
MLKSYSLRFAALAAISLTLASCAPSMMGTPATTPAAPDINAGLNSLQRLTVAQPSPTAVAGGLTLTSPTFTNGGVYPGEHVANGFGCTGPNTSPALNWTGVPAGTQSLVLTKYDPDAPTGSGFWHWSVYNIPATATGLAAGSGNTGGTLPAGALQLNHDGGAPGFVGACPPVGDKPHRYVFTLYALSKTLDVPATASPAFLGFNLNGITLAKASITAFYSR